MRKIFLTLSFIFFVIPIVISQDLPSYIPTDGLVAYYPFNGNANDQSGNGNHGTVNGATLTSDRNGVENSSYLFDNSNISIENQFYNNGYETYTINIWFLTYNPSKTMQCLLNTTPHDGEGIGYNHENALNTFSHGKNSNVSQHLWDIFSSNPFGFQVQENMWYMITIVKNSGNYSYYVNKSLDKISTTSLTAENQNTGLIFGSTSLGSEFLSGKLDDIGIWNRVLSEQEIQNLYTSSSGDILLNGTVSAENNQIKNVADPTHSQDVTTKKYVDSKTSEISNSQNISNNSQIGLTGVVYDLEGNRYETVIMCDGKQWTTQYLNVSFFANGDPIPEVVGNDAWRDLTTPAWCYPFNEDSGIGKLYNGFALTDARGLAPEGWHIATEDDWNNLIECLGGADVAGGKIKLSGTEYWAAPNVGSGPSGKASNSSGMSLTPAASREGANGNFYSQNSVGFWNYSTIDGRRPYVELIGDQARINQGLTDPYDGSYILLVKD
ncbi:MAG: FISUMP domain-containing protein [Flavobacteriaceae bacterium]|jgi:uncharacterized protein (TIGR02145 family)